MGLDMYLLRSDKETTKKVIQQEINPLIILQVAYWKSEVWIHEWFIKQGINRFEEQNSEEYLIIVRRENLENLVKKLRKAFKDRDFAVKEFLHNKILYTGHKETDERLIEGYISSIISSYRSIRTELFLTRYKKDIEWLYYARR